jgi:hypothetical protein
MRLRLLTHTAFGAITMTRLATDPDTTQLSDVQRAQPGR